MTKTETRTPVQKIEISRRARNLLIAGGITFGIVAGVGAAALFPAARDTLACEVSTEVQFSPGGKFRVQKAEKTCHWGLGQAAERVQIKIDKQAKGGWLMVLPLEFDGADPASVANDEGPTIKWKSANALEVIVHSSELSGSLVRRIDDLTVTRRYVKVSRK
jgi:hypothetical protein